MSDHASLISRYLPALQKLYGADEQAYQQACKRYLQLEDLFFQVFPAASARTDVRFYSTPGRSEILGNHTDHQKGHVICASISLDIIAAVQPTDTGLIRLHSEGYNQLIEVNLNDLAVKEAEFGKSAALIRGIVHKMQEEGLKIGGFDACVISNVPGGSGLSSSAAFEVLLVTIIDDLYNGNKLSPLQRAQISQYAENVYFNKPCGLMDQCGTSFGGLIALDFADSKQIKVKQLANPLTSSNYRLLITKTGGSHADLTADYAAIPAEMKEVAHCFGKNYLAEVPAADFWRRLGQLREQVSDRALLRAFHFFQEEERVAQAISALERQDLPAFFAVVRASGLSSALLLQNIYSNHAPLQQGVSLALALSEKVLQGQGACRVHGGGFAGTIQAYVPTELVEKYRETLEQVLGQGSVYDLQIRPYGSINLANLL